MKDHLTKCKNYRAAYMQKLTSKKVNEALNKELQRYEEDLDEVNIRIQRQLAERDVQKKIEEDKSVASSSGGFFGWMWGGKKAATSTEASTEMSKTVKKLEEALTASEKQQLYEAIDYQESAHRGIYPKSFVARWMSFNLDRLTVLIRDDDLRNSEILRLTLAEVRA
jgi:integrase